MDKLIEALDLSNAYTQHPVGLPSYGASVSLHFRNKADSDAFVTAFIEHIQRRNASRSAT